MGQTITLYNVEVEIPAGLFISSIEGGHIPVALWGDDGELITHRSGAEEIAIEMFAATAAMRWRDIYTALERPGAPGAGNLIDMGKINEYEKAREQFGEWNEVRIRAIKAHVKQEKKEEASEPCRTSATTPAVSPSAAPSSLSKGGSSKQARRTS